MNQGEFQPKSKIDKVTESIDKLRAKGNTPSKIILSRSYAIALKEETIKYKEPQI